MYLAFRAFEISRAINVATSKQQQQKQKTLYD